MAVHIICLDKNLKLTLLMADFRYASLTLTIFANGIHQLKPMVISHRQFSCALLLDSPIKINLKHSSQVEKHSLVLQVISHGLL